MSRRSKRKKQDKQDLFAANQAQGEQAVNGGSGEKLSRTTIHRYREKGYDVGPKGNPDYAKAAAIHEQEKHKERDGSQQTKESQYWNDRYKKSRALAAEMELSQALGRLVEAAEVEREAFQVYRDARDHLMNAPNRIAGEIAAELELESGHGREKIFLILTREFTETLEMISHGTSQS